jgi:hypothetical protein
MKEEKTTVNFPEHTFICNVDDADPSKGRAFSVSATITPAIAFENGQAKSVALEPGKTEGSSAASAAVTSLRHTLAEVEEGCCSRGRGHGLPMSLPRRLSQLGILREIRPAA